ncbi:hypothetical protein ACO0RG_004086 [Hanseniaspora osmophila]|uniref:Anthranilate phosphoribosyltransferase n=1 Tax=Hanseniaspora osmophila TaxID=56408 RepID=A0A1E5RAA5_9ASCO|nr:Anthranilate phosphoribosyltransferase [Hanseniaspora osmophila]
MSEFTKNLSVHTKSILNGTFVPQNLYDCLIDIVTYLSTTKFSPVNEDEKLQSYVNISSFLTALRSKELDIKAEYIASAAKAILTFSNVVQTERIFKDLTSNSTQDEQEIVADIVGTGGDGQNTFNVSTSAAIVVSGIPGIKIVKHGGKASTSNSGAGDLINHLGVVSAKVHSANVEKHLYHKNKFLFLLASQFHNGMFHLAELRKLMKIPTIFNVLGPLLHPVDLVNKRILGVYSEKLGQEYAKASKLIYPNSNTMVVFGKCGLDELSPIGETKIWEVSPDSNEILTFQLSPQDFGLQEYPLSQCLSEGPKENAEFLENKILKGAFHKGENPIYDYILLNSALLYCLCTNTKDYKNAVAIVEESIHSGAALSALHSFVASVQELEI